MDREDAPALLTIVGVLMTAFGVDWRRPGLIVLGVIVLLYVRPLARWVK